MDKNTLIEMACILAQHEIIEKGIGYCQAINNSLNAICKGLELNINDFLI